MSESILPPPRHCSKCRALKALDEFGKNRSRPNDVDVYCKQCRRAAGHRYRTSSKGRATKKVYRENPKGREIQRRAGKKHSAKEDVKQKRRARRRTPKARAAANKYWRSLEGRTVRWQSHTKARVEAAQDVTWTFSSLLDAQGWRCYICGGDMPFCDVSGDHFIPLSKGGRHADDNVAVTHHLCNVRKSFYLPEEYEALYGPFAFVPEWLSKGNPTSRSG